MITACPRCDYSLQGLPDVGNCPECGFEYERDSTLLEQGRERSTSFFFASIAMMVLVRCLHSVMKHWSAAMEPLAMVLTSAAVLGLIAVVVWQYRRPRRRFVLAEDAVLIVERDRRVHRWPRARVAALVGESGFLGCVVDAQGNELIELPLGWRRAPGIPNGSAALQDWMAATAPVCPEHARRGHSQDEPNSPPDLRRLASLSRILRRFARTQGSYGLTPMGRACPRCLKSKAKQTVGPCSSCAFEWDAAGHTIVAQQARPWLWLFFLCSLLGLIAESGFGLLLWGCHCAALGLLATFWHPRGHAFVLSQDHLLAVESPGIVVTVAWDRLGGVAFHRTHHTVTLLDTNGARLLSLLPKGFGGPLGALRAAAQIERWRRERSGARAALAVAPGEFLVEAAPEQEQARSHPPGRTG